jgi:DNA/RNA endonuclease G (NUC1)
VGANGVAVPHAYYAIVVRGGTPDVQAFLVPNEPASRGWDEAGQFLTNVDQIEQLTSFDFLSDLPDPLENTIEATTAEAPWDS